MDKKGVGGVVVLLLLSVFGAFFVAPVFQHQVAVQENTATTTATVTATDIDVKTDDEGDESYSPVVTYTYTVEGETYENDNVFPGGFQRWRDSRSWAEGIVAEHDVGTEATVSYNPDDPTRAYIRNDGLPSSWILGVAYALVALLGAGWLIRAGIRRWRQRSLMEGTPTENARSLSVGTSEIKGTAVTGDGKPLTAPFSDEECVVAEYEVEEYDDDDDDSGGSWKTIEKGVWHTPFYVDDGTGRVLVQPHDEATYDLSPGDRATTYVDSSDRGPAPIREFVEKEGIGFPRNAPGKDNDRRYSQNLIKPDENVYVFGTAYPRDDASGADNAERLVIGMGEGTMSGGPMFLISDDSEKNLVARRRWALWRFPVGGLFLIAAVFTLLVIFGPGLGVTLPVHF
ncbi:MAG: DUF3592 domain-containing protein [Halobacteriales archaeon]|nr:DUF3592 domain-containing protein [Halobacteriales archaeon]